MSREEFMAPVLAAARPLSSPERMYRELLRASLRENIQRTPLSMLQITPIEEVAQ